MDKECMAAAPRSPEDRNYPDWCCQTCGEVIGYIGRGFQWIGLPLHDCRRSMARAALELVLDAAYRLAGDGYEVNRAVIMRDPLFAPSANREELARQLDRLHNAIEKAVSLRNG